jgi:hypothetical protein
VLPTFFLSTLFGSVANIFQKCCQHFFSSTFLWSVFRNVINIFDQHFKLVTRILKKWKMVKIKSSGRDKRFPPPSSRSGLKSAGLHKRPNTHKKKACVLRQHFYFLYYFLIFQKYMTDLKFSKTIPQPHIPWR